MAFVAFDLCQLSGSGTARVHRYPLEASLLPRDFIRRNSCRIGAAFVRLT